MRCNNVDYYFRAANFFNGNSDEESTYDCKGGRMQVRKYADRFDKNGTVCNDCNGSGRRECEKCNGYGYLTSKETYDDVVCRGTGKIKTYQKWMKGIF